MYTLYIDDISQFIAKVPIPSSYLIEAVRGLNDAHLFHQNVLGEYGDTFGYHHALEDLDDGMPCMYYIDDEVFEEIEIEQ